MKTAFLYAGQGSQHPGMGADLYEAYPEFRAVLDSAEVGFDLKTVSFTDPDGVLNQTRVHPALHGGLCRRHDRHPGRQGHPPGLRAAG